jgi:hypothetical protein
LHGITEDIPRSFEREMVKMPWEQAMQIENNWMRAVTKETSEIPLGGRIRCVHSVIFHN